MGLTRQVHAAVFTGHMNGSGPFLSPCCRDFFLGAANSFPYYNFVSYKYIYIYMAFARPAKVMSLVFLIVKKLSVVVIVTLRL